MNEQTNEGIHININNTFNGIINQLNMTPNGKLRNSNKRLQLKNETKITIFLLLLK